MQDMHEIVNAAAVGRLFALLAILLPIVGVTLGGLLGLRRNAMRRGLLLGFGFGLIGPANWLLWLMYNAITAHNGLDTVRNFALNLAVFVVIGLCIGVVLGRMWRAYPVSPEMDAVGEETSD